MLGTFSFEPYFKSYLYFTVWSLEILEIANRSFLPPPACLLALFFPVAAVQCRRRHGETAGHLCFALAPTRRSGASPPPLASRWCPLPLPRHPEQPRGRHLAAAVESPLQHPRASSLASTSTTSIPANYSSLSPFPCSPTSERRRRPA